MDRCEGDLNNDGFPDQVLVLESLDSIPAEDPDALWSKPWNPRMLVILLYDGLNGNYRKVVESTDFILTDEGNATMDEPFVGIECRKNGTLRIDFRYWYSAGSWSMGTSSYIFRYQNHRFELIGQELTHVHRGTGGSSLLSINYSTRRTILTTKEYGDSEEVTTPGRFDIDELPTFQSIGEAKFIPETDLDFEFP